MAGNILQTTTAKLQKCPCFDAKEGFQSYLSDESRFKAESIETIFFPENIEQVAEAVSRLGNSGKSCVISAGRTGITAAASPTDADAVISLEKMNGILGLGVDNGEYYIRLEPGVSLQQLDEFLLAGKFSALTGMTEKEKLYAAEFSASKTKLWFPVNPTETSAHLGGIVANNASGARTYRYGCAREWVRALKVVLPNGEILQLRRGEAISAGLSKREFVLRQSCGKPELTFCAPLMEYPQTKCTCGYFAADHMDAIDLFIGSEGTLGIISEIELRLIQRPEQTCGIIAFCRSEEQAVKFVSLLREKADCDALEYFDHNSLRMINESRPGVFNLPDWNSYAVYCELSGDNNKVDTEAGRILQALAECGIVPEKTWATDEPRGLRMQKDFRHAIPEAVNSLIGRRKKGFPQLHKIGTDMAVPFDNLGQMLNNYRQGLNTFRLDSVIFGHIGDGHVHVNILPENPEQLEEAKSLYQKWAADAVRMGGTIAAEHGIGRIKKSLMPVQYNSDIIQQMNILRRLFDPSKTLARGVLFD